MELHRTTDDDEVQIGKEPLTGATDTGHGAEEDLRILAEHTTRAAPQLGDETGRVI
jgi:hypothetical protein